MPKSYHRIVAQGEDFPIYFKMVTPSSELREVWAETDEGHKTLPQIPLYNTTNRILFTSEETEKFAVGEHYVRVWVRTVDGLKLNLFELFIAVNQKFPLEEDKPYYPWEDVVYNTRNVSPARGVTVLEKVYRARKLL